MSRVLAIVLATALALFVASTAGAQQRAKEGAKRGTKEEEPKSKKTQVSSNDTTPAEYKPPARGKPRARVGGGVRGVDRMWPSVFALVPDHAGLTVSDQPSLFWYVDTSPGEELQVVFTLSDEAAIEPLVERELPGPKQRGIQRIDLAELGVKLEAGRSYEWSVALVQDPAQRAKDIVTMGWIDRVDRPPALGTTPEAYAAEGLWYDALTVASDRMKNQPEDAAAREGRDALLLQVGLGAAVR